MTARGPRRGDLFGLAGAAILAAFLLSRFGGGEVSVPDYIGKPLPPMLVEGWLNRPEGRSIDPAGKILVLDCWASWCGPCVASLPEMAKLAAEYEPLGVEFLGVTSETASDIPDVERVIARTKGFTWPVGYGGEHLFDALGVRGIPTVFLFGADGHCRWVGNSIEALADKIDEALVAKGSGAHVARRG